MAEEELVVVTLHDNYYRDSFGRIIYIMISLIMSVAAVIAIACYMVITIPPPITFHVGQEFRIMEPVPITDGSYPEQGDMLQWVGNVVKQLFNVDFLHMDSELAAQKQYFTDSGYQIFLNQFKNNVAVDSIATGKLFVKSEITGAPFILHEGDLSGRYAWWVQIPVNISYAGMTTVPPNSLTLQLLVVRTETTDNLAGVAIDNVVVAKVSNNKILGNG